jgi:hypothetical protein
LAALAAEDPTERLEVSSPGAFAPTRPHPGTESALANLALGAPRAVIDRARDLLRESDPQSR